MITLHGYWRSSAAYRVRIALNLLQLEHQHQSVHLVKDGGQQHQAQYSELNASHLVPTLVDGDVVLGQSMAIIEYLDESYGEHLLLPKEAMARAHVRSMAQDISCDVHPINNLRVMQHLSTIGDFSSDDKSAWMCHWMDVGFKALEIKLADSAGDFCFGDKPSLADICLIPQLYNAHRFGLSLVRFPIISRIERNCLALEAFKLAIPENQADAS